MKKFIIIVFSAFVLISACMIISSFTILQNETSGIHGTIKPADMVKKVWAISDKDTVSIVPSAGAFSLDVKPANWKLYVEAIKPYKDVTVTNIIVEAAKYTDVGEIKLTSDQR
ncbi:hypothetical protein [Ferruginibacter sp. SUN106]|uniref:hypothetical protein n=1 Tax=Ferruginibacter sp. SUN106 TaxID=2978348 RepID=UPI003D365C79